MTEYILVDGIKTDKMFSCNKESKLFIKQINNLITKILTHYFYKITFSINKILITNNICFSDVK